PGQLRGRGLAQETGRQDASAGGPDEPGARPRHALEKPTPVDAVSSRVLGVLGAVFLLIVHCVLRFDRSGSHFTITLPVIRGWRVQKYSYTPGFVNLYE